MSRSLEESRLALDVAYSAFPEGDHRHVISDATRPEGLEHTITEKVESHGTPEILIYNPRGAIN